MYISPGCYLSEVRPLERNAHLGERMLQVVAILVQSLLQRLATAPVCLHSCKIQSYKIGMSTHRYQRTDDCLVYVVEMPVVKTCNDLSRKQQHEVRGLQSEARQSRVVLEVEAQILGEACPCICLSSSRSQICGKKVDIASSDSFGIHFKYETFRRAFLLDRNVTQRRIANGYTCKYVSR